MSKNEGILCPSHRFGETFQAILLSRALAFSSVVFRWKTFVVQVARKQKSNPKSIGVGVSLIMTAVGGIDTSRNACSLTSDPMNALV